MQTITYEPIGIIHSEFIKPKGVPIQPTGANMAKGSIDLFPKYIEGLKDLDGFSHIILLYHFHLSKIPELIVNPYMDNEEKHGIFATRAPSRPNSIGLSIVKLIGIEKNILFIQDVDIVDGTPLLDIKPYISKFDLRENVKIGWLNKNIHKLSETKDDERFTN
ncbi:MAG: tRNA (N6-threonylcarbamoyladenosine(37)-N6)-methyltransferase TrmO [Bacteroidetes bacterium]|nr:tRNA (N6-threonylcarbamoyladenosine(37)-N6)-methyltransferase TrmO [Bacteroidota bacterium]MBU1115898.1 tRNA (N6-threonylcarbamoyladenosine(37)-N6)-methyltransferase TrmO [Bacteroidota bacterium]MBU1798743.1 tRNA (N6-threonylcarbamoyladenosine(37)-N6)-methyltransferase TrmO [Bacteroidota bacterium]